MKYSISVILSIIAVTILCSFAQAQKKNIGDHFNGEHLDYNVSIFPLLTAAEAGFTFQPDTTVPRGYKAILKARVSDLVKLILFHRYEQEITAYFTMAPDGKRLYSRRLVNISKVNGKVTRELIMEVDYDRLTTFWKVYKKGVLKGEGGSSFKAGEYLDDPMCTFYNLRYGVYGQIKYGESLDVTTLPTKKLRTIHLQMPNEEETRKRRGNEVYQQSRQYLVKINTDSEFFESRRGDVEVWFSKDMKPLEAAVKGVAWVGDVRGYLKTRKEADKPSPH